VSRPTRGRQGIRSQRFAVASLSDGSGVLPWPSRSGSLAMLAAMRRASSRDNNFTAERRPGSFSKYTYASFSPLASRTIKGGVVFLEGPRRREAAGFGHRVSLARLTASAASPTLSAPQKRHVEGIRSPPPYVILKTQIEERTDVWDSDCRCWLPLHPSITCCYVGVA
jgi:hypothetical protein